MEKKLFALAQLEKELMSQLKDNVHPKHICRVNLFVLALSNTHLLIQCISPFSHIFQKIYSENRSRYFEPKYIEYIELCTSGNNICCEIYHVPASCSKSAYQLMKFL